MNIIHTRRKWAVPSLPFQLPCRQGHGQMTSYFRNNLLSLPPSASEDALSGSGSGIEADAETVRSDCPADEGQGVLRPGSASISRQNERKDAFPGWNLFEATIVAQNVY